MSRNSHAANNARSNSLNPNNPAYGHSIANRANQLNPDHTTYQGPSKPGIPSTPTPANAHLQKHDACQGESKVGT